MGATLLSWRSAEDQHAISVVVGRRFAIGAGGQCLDAGDYTIVEELVYYSDEALGPREGYIRPSLLQRDVDLYPWRERTDVVVQGTARLQRPMAQIRVELSCRGSRVSFSQAMQVTGDRFVEAGPGGLRLSEPEPFSEMPLRLDKAYGGTDEAAVIRYSDRERDAMIYAAVGEPLPVPADAAAIAVAQGALWVAGVAPGTWARRVRTG